MGITPFPYGISSFGVPIVGGQGLMTQGKCFFVKPYSGSDGNSGLSPAKAFKTLSKALSACTANKNDTVYLFAEGNTGSLTTDYLTANLDWNKDLTHLIGIGTGSMVGQRARVSTSTVLTTAMMTISANGCIFSNIGWFFGVATTTTTNIGAVNVTGDRNYFHNCQISGIGHADMDVADAYSLQLSGADENTFDGCYIGLDTIARGTGDNCEITLESGSTRNIFKDCIISTLAEANTHQFVKVPATGIDRFVMFKNCTFYNAVSSTGVSMLEALDITAGTSPSGMVLLDNSTLVGAAAWEASSGASGRTYSMNAPTPAASTNGIAAVVA